MENSLPLISVVVPSFNQSQFLKQALDSIFDQDYPKVEVVVMDGGSTDGSLEIIEAYAERLTYWQSKPDGGQSLAINAGMAWCNGDLVAWLNSDDFYYGNSLWEVANAYQSNSDRGLYIGNGFRYVQETGKYHPFFERHLAFNRKAFNHGLDYILQPSVFFSQHAWKQVGGLNPDLNFCMDWDILIRISNNYSVALINEFLAVSREYAETKTSSGKLKRVYEIANMVTRHTGKDLTPGSAFYILETLLNISKDGDLNFLSNTLFYGLQNIQLYFKDHYGNIDGFPEITDDQNEIYLPFARSNASSTVKLKRVEGVVLPKISLVVPSFNQAQFLGQTLESIFNQNYPELEVIVVDGGSSDNSVEIIKSYESQLAYWHSKPDTGPADAINQGMTIAKGDLIAWLSSDDLLSHNALWEVAAAFLEDSSLDLVYGNALYVDEHNQLYLADHGAYRTGIYYGKFQSYESIPLYWTYVHSVPQPTVFFRRTLLETVGSLNQTFSFIFDFELFCRFSQNSKIKKIERVQAFYRIHSSSKTSSWNNFLVELYRFSRPRWPSIVSREFWFTLKSFLKYYTKAYYLHYPRRDPRFWVIVVLISLSVTLKIGNPEYLEYLISRRHSKTKQVESLTQTSSQPQNITFPDHLLPEVKYLISRDETRYRSLFCSYFLPLHPGYSGGEIRDFHILRHLLSLSEVDFFALYGNPYQDRSDCLKPYLNKYIALDAIDLLDEGKEVANADQPRNVVQRLVRERYHHDVEYLRPFTAAGLAPIIQQSLEDDRPDFLFVSPQVNPVILDVKAQALNVRCIMASYDVELVRMRRVSQGQWRLWHPKKMLSSYMEPRRAARFERDNLAHFDGIIAVSELDKSIFVSEYGFEPERVLVVNNSVDTQYFSFMDRWPTEQPNITFVGSLTYPPNRQAALRLIQKIMPLVRQQQPNVRLWIVGQAPGEDLLSYNDGEHVFVTGKVEDVRPYLAQSTAMCAPLSSGSGTKYKILEALSAGVPVVCSSLALEGLNLTPNEHLLSADEDQEVASAILKLIADPVFGARLAWQGRNLIDQEYSWDNSLQGIGPWLDAIAHLPKRTG
ncbi:MAG: glycosyltransferase [Nodosilinea sp. WJT8-NPBG4]|jgi:glycosyltransferase involved in cell wall biosynthesis|nr:glycosyltransferase [Nodosilinea sp. WJT8-NPBG4]